MSIPISVYVHIPFCPSKCGYCDFNSYAMEGEIVNRTVQATIAQIERSPLRGRPAKTVFFGGGTPTQIPSEGLIQILEAVLDAHPLVEGAEVTSEANPGTVDAAKFAAMRRSGFNRISMGAQSFADGDLIRLGRVHQARDIEAAVLAARGAGFDNLNLDLMFGLPGQSSAGWRHNLDRALGLRVEHLSLYCLTVEPNTDFWRQAAKGELQLPDDEEQVNMYEECANRLGLAGFEQYEISNYCRPGRECRHNLEYWQGGEYAGYGPGAVGSYFLDGKRIRATCLKHPARYCEAIEAGQRVEFDVEVLEDGALHIEEIMLGLRLNRGVARSRIRAPEATLVSLLERGWIELNGEQVRLTAGGRHFCSEVTLELI